MVPGPERPFKDRALDFRSRSGRQAGPAGNPARSDEGPISAADRSAESNRMASVARLRRRTHEILENARSGDELSFVVDVGLIALVTGNVLAVVLQSVDALDARYRDLFEGFERVSVAAFTAEYLLRIWSAAERAEEHGGAMRSRLRYVFSPMALADLAAIAPFYLSALFSVDLRFLRILRLLRVLKLTRYSGAMHRFGEVVRSQQSAFATAFALLLLVMIFASSVMYVVEHEAQPEAFASIPSAMWWAVCTLTTVGYGDVTPVTPMGKFVASLITLIGIGMVALPTSILASGFSEVSGRHRRQLEAEVALAAEDGVVTEAEADAITELAQRLGVASEEAEEIVFLAREHSGVDLQRPCPHCGKPAE